VKEGAVGFVEDRAGRLIGGLRLRLGGLLDRAVVRDRLEEASHDELRVTKDVS